MLVPVNLYIWSSLKMHIILLKEANVIVPFILKITALIEKQCFIIHALFITLPWDFVLVQWPCLFPVFTQDVGVYEFSSLMAKGNNWITEVKSGSLLEVVNAMTNDYTYILLNTTSKTVKNLKLYILHTDAF